MTRRFRSVRGWGILVSVAMSVAVCALVAGCTPRPGYPDQTTQEERDNAQRMIIGLSAVEDFDQEVIREVDRLAVVADSLAPGLVLETRSWPRRYDACDSPLHLSIGRASSSYAMNMSLSGSSYGDVVLANWETLKAELRESAARLGFTGIDDYAPSRDTDQYGFAMYNTVQGSISIAYAPKRSFSITGFTGCRPSRTETVAATPTGVR